MSGIISASEAHELVNFFFEYMDPFFPFIRQVFPNEWLLSRHVFLFATICTIAAKYSQRIDSYERLRPVLTDLLFTAPWADMQAVSKFSSGSGTVLALLLGVEWLVDEKEGPACVEQYNRASWVQLGVAVRIAQYTRCLDASALAMPAGAAVATALTSLDAVVGCRLGLGPSMRLLDSSHLPIKLAARASVTELLSITFSTLYANRTTSVHIHSPELSTSLERVREKFKLWDQKFGSLLDGSFEAQSLLFEYNHAKLYAFSIAVPYIELEQYVYMAVEGAQGCIDFELSIFNVKGIAAPPMRWIVRLIHASVFLAKVLESPPIDLDILSVKKSVKDAADIALMAGERNFQIMGPCVKLLEEVAAYVGEPALEELDFGDLDAFLAPFLEI